MLYHSINGALPRCLEQFNDSSVTGFGRLYAEQANKTRKSIQVVLISNEGAGDYQMASNSIVETIMGLAMILGSSLGLVLAGVLVVGLLLGALDRTRNLLGRGDTAM